MSRKVFLFLLLSIPFINVFGQPLAIPIYATFKTIENTFQIDSLKQYYTKNGFKLVKEANLDMYSNYENAVIMPLKEGTWYRAVFVGDKLSKEYQARLFDYEDKKTIAINQRPKDAEGNILSFDYIPKFTEFHALRLIQINKLNKKPFGYLMMFKMQININ